MRLVEDNSSSSSSSSNSSSNSNNNSNNVAISRRTAAPSSSSPSAEDPPIFHGEEEAHLPRKGRSPSSFHSPSSAAALLLITAAVAFTWASPFLGVGTSPRQDRDGAVTTTISPPPPPPSNSSGVDHITLLQHHQQQRHRVTTGATMVEDNQHSICNRTLFPRLCLSTSTNANALVARHHHHNDHRHLLRLHLAHASIGRAAAFASKALSRIKSLLTDLDHLTDDPRRKAALEDCGYMLRRSLHLLGKAALRLRVAAASTSRLPPPPRRIRVLVSAAMTYQDSCLDGFNGCPLVVAREHLRRRLRPISRLLSNSLAIVRDLEEEEGRVARPWEQPGSRWRRALIGRGRPPPDVVVAKKGRGNMRTIAEAVLSAPAWSRRRYVVWIKAGTYEENVAVPANKTNLVFIGDGWDRTVISGQRSVADGWTTFGSATLSVAGAGFLARDLAVVNMAGPSKGQAVALRVDADCSAFYRCNISGYQDTLYAHSLSQFYRECVVRGTVDFIFGNAAAVFQNCRVEVLHPNTRQKNMITAQGRDDPNQPTGTTLDNCTIVAANDKDDSNNDSKNKATTTTSGNHSRSSSSSRISREVDVIGETYLGRPWRRYARTMVMNSYLGGIIHPKGWHEWSEPRPLEKVELCEYGNRGPGAGTSRRVVWARCNASREDAEQFAVGDLIGGRWLNATAYPFYSGMPA